MQHIHWNIYFEKLINIYIVAYTIYIISYHIPPSISIKCHLIYPAKYGISSCM